jgi:hypothetical protein
MKTLSMKLPEALDAQLTAMAKQRGISKAAAAREALEEWLGNARGQRGVTCGELAGDLLGSVEGPGDLSCNPAHMEGYGR